jgi:predicted transcriptional regulator
VADEKDWAFINGLQSLGANRNAAKLITYLKDVEEGSSRDIEMATDLRQPEVCVAMGILRDMGWISERDVKGIGKGRPQKIYALRATIEEILEHYEAGEEPGVNPDNRGHPEAEGVKLCVTSEDHIVFNYFSAQTYSLFDCWQVFHQE